MSGFETDPEALADDSTLRSQRVWKAAGEHGLDVESQRLRERLRAKMFGVEAAPLRIGRFSVLETVGAGGMGVVYAAYDQELDRRVAVKLLQASRDDDTSVGEGRLLREAQALAKLSHPNVVQVYEVGTFSDRVFLAMEFLPGPDLRTWLLEAPRPWTEVLRCFIDAGRGLAAAHQQGVIHRDFKPANLLFGADRRVRVVDFGLARAAGELRLEPVPLGAAGSSQVLATELTQTGEIMGTPAYMSPEQARHEPVDARSDQYSFCVALYEALFGLRPHAGRSTAEVLIAVAEGDVRQPPRNTKVPARVVRAVMRGLSADPAQRFPSIEALLEQLEPQDRGRWRWVVGAGAAVAACVGALMLVGEAPCPSFDNDLDEAWGATRRAAVEAAFVATRAAGARASLDLTGDRLDDYARDWLAARRDACEAHLVRREQSAALHDRRVACLFERRAELATLTQALAAADAGVVERAPLAAAELTVVSDCSDLERLQRQGEVDPVRQDLRVRLAQAQAQYKVGHYEPALATLAAVSEAAHQHDAPEIEAAGLFHRGTIHHRRRALAAANEAFEQAIDLAEAGGDDEQAVLAWTYLARNQSGLGLIEWADHSQRRARAKALRLGEVRLEHEVQESQAVVDWQAERFDEAIEGQGLVVEWVRETFGEQHPRMADAEHRYANILSGAGRHEEAQQRYTRALAVLEQTLGAEHPELARVWFDMGLDHHEAGRDAEAVRALEQAERRFETAVGPRAPELVELNKLLAHLAQRLGNLDEADRRIHVQIELADRGGLPEHEHLDLLSLQAMVASQRRDHAQAIAACHAYLERLEDVPATPDLEVQALFMRAILVTELGAVGRWGEAEPTARRLIDELASRGDDPSVAALRAHSWLVIARSTEARGQRGPAAEAYRAGLESVAKADLAEAEPRAVQARLQWGLGRVLPASEAATARSLVAGAREALAKAEPRAPELAEMDAWLRAAD